MSGHDGAGAAVQFDDSGAVASIAASTHEQQVEMTVAFWARAASPGADKVLVALTGSDCDSPWSITTGATGSLAFTAYMADRGPVTATSAVEPGSLWNGAWHFLAVTIRLGPFDGQVNTWVDGLCGAGAVIGGAALVDYAAPELEIAVGGPRTGCPGGTFTGAVDDLRVWDRVLSADELGSAVAQIPTTIGLAVAPTFEYCDPHVGIDVSLSPTPRNGGWVDISVDDGSGPVVALSSWWTMSSGTFWSGCFPVGDDMLTATFRGIAPFLGSTSDPVPISVTKRHTHVTLQTSFNPVPSDMDAVLSMDAWPGTGMLSLYEVTGGARTLVTTKSSGPSVAYVGGLSVGTHEFQAEYAGDDQSLPSVSDVLPIEVVAPQYPTTSISPLRSTTMSDSITVSWGGTAGWAPVRTYDVRYRRARWNAGFESYTTLRSATSATSAAIMAVPGYTYCVSARARDSIGHVSSWTPETCTAVPLDDRSLAHSGNWSATTGDAHYRSTILRTRIFGSTLVKSGVAGRQFGLVATTCPTCGSVRVYWGSALIRTISLYSETVQHRRVLPITMFAAVRRGTLTIRVASSGKPVRVDGLVVKRR